MVDYKNYETLIYDEKKNYMVIYQNYWSFEQNLLKIKNFDLLWTNYGTNEKKLWFYAENYGTLIYYGKNSVL